MVFLTKVLAGALALGCIVSAGEFHPQPEPFRPQRGRTGGGNHKPPHHGGGHTHPGGDKPPEGGGDHPGKPGGNKPPHHGPPMAPFTPEQIANISRPGNVGKPSLPSVMAAQNPMLDDDCDFRENFLLREMHSVNWTGAGGAVAQLSFRTRPNERAIDTEYLERVLEEMTCPGQLDREGDIVLSFQHEDYFAATKGWEWVNEKKDNELLLVVGSGFCDWNKDRILYRSRSIKINDKEKKVVLKAETITWEKALHKYHLKMKRDSSQNNELQTRGDPDLSIDLGMDFSGNGIQLDAAGYTVMAMCVECYTRGTLDFDVEWSLGWFELDKAAITMSTSGIEVRGNYQVQLKGEVGEQLPRETKSLVSVAPVGISIPGVITLGPRLDISTYASVKFRAGVIIGFGATATVPPSSATLDFINEDGDKGEGWTVNWESDPLNVQGMAEVWCDFGLMTSIGIEASVLSTGFQGVIEMETPGIWAALRALVSPTCTACEKYSSAIQGFIQIGTSITLALQEKVGGKVKDLWALTLFKNVGDPLAQFCEPFGEQNPECSADNSTESFHRRAPSPERIQNWYA